MLDRPISQRAKIQAAKKRFPFTNCNWHNSKVNFIHVSGPDVLLNGIDTAANLDVLCACRSPRVPLPRVCAQGLKIGSTRIVP